MTKRSQASSATPQAVLSTDGAARIQQRLNELALPFETINCDPELADTAVFCAHYGFALEDSANCLLVAGKAGGEKHYVACVVLASTRLDVNKTVRKRLGVRRISFASAEETLTLTGMALGGVTPIGLPAELHLWVDSQVMARERIILGGGSRSCKIAIAPDLFRRTPNTCVVEGLALNPAAV